MEDKACVTSATFPGKKIYMYMFYHVQVTVKTAEKTVNICTKTVGS